MRRIVVGALALSGCWICFNPTNARAQDPSPSATPAPPQFESLKGKSDEELVRLVIGGKSAWKLQREEQRANEVETHFPDRFWEMPPKDAALALVRENCNLKLKPQLKVSVREDKTPPTDKGSVALQSESGYYSMARESLLILSSDGVRSTLEFSSVELHGPVKRSVIERALHRTKRSALSVEEARRLYEVIWWLGGIQFAWPERADADQATTERIVADHSVRGKLTVEPDSLRKQEFTLCPASLSECYYETFDHNLYAGFVHFILRETLKRHGVNLDETTTGELGEESFSSEAEKFVYTSTPPPPSDPDASKWIERMLRNLEKYRSGVISKLASLDEPLRYTDPRIDEALFRVARQGLTPRAPERRTGRSDFEDAVRAAHALATRKRKEAFPIIMQLLQGRPNETYAKDELLDAASLLSPASPDFEQKLMEYLTTQFNELTKSPHSSSELFDSVWRANLRGLTPLLEKMATASPEEIEDERGSTRAEPPRPVVGRFHGPRRILVAWGESDALTKLKLDAIIEASSFHLGGPAAFLRQEFKALPADQQQKFIAFVGWMETQRPEDSSWYLKSLKEVFGSQRW
jgi:hypothetical protein